VLLRGGLITAALVVVAFTAFLFAVEHPATRGPLRCWIQESFYEQDWAPAPDGTPIVEAVQTTEPVIDLCDAADDPAIWVSDDEPDEVFVLGTNKQSSVNVYDLSGALVSRTAEIGAPNNVDLRAHDGRIVVMASDKDDAQVEAFILDPHSGVLRPLPGAPFPAEAEDEVYGACLYDAGNALFAFTTDKSGLVVQYELSLQPETQSLRKVRELRVSTQPEGCVVDDANAVLFVGEEDVGIWRFDADTDGSTHGLLIAETGAHGPLVADVEGIAIYTGETAEEGFLIASSQGDNTFAVFDRAAPHAFRGHFQVSFNGEIIGDTDGLDVTSTPISAAYPKGLLVIQDGFIRDSRGERRNQRFAYVSWADIEIALGL